MDGLISTLKLVHKMSPDIIKLIIAVQNFVRCRDYSSIYFDNGSYQKDVKFHVFIAKTLTWHPSDSFFCHDVVDGGCKHFLLAAIQFIIGSCPI